MKKILFLAIVLLFIVGCSSDNAVDKEAKEMEENKELAQEEMEKRAEEAQSAKPDAEQELINFYCTVADVQNYYFYKNKIKIESPAAEGWLIDDVYYVRVAAAGKTYLVTGMTEEAEITVEGMMNMYNTAKATPNIDCTLGGVTEAKVKLPDLEIITNEEFSEKMMEDMMGGMS